MRNINFECSSSAKLQNRLYGAVFQTGKFHFPQRCGYNHRDRNKCGHNKHLIVAKPEFCILKQAKYDKCKTCKYYIIDLGEEFCVDQM